MRAGLAVSFIRETKEKKTSDLSIETDSGTLFVEITRLGQSAETREAFSYFNREDWRVPEFEGLKVDIRLEKFVSRPRLKELLEGVAAEAKTVRLSGLPGSYTAPGLLSARIEKMEGTGKSSFAVAGWPTDSDEVDRLARALRRKAQQLPADRPGMLIILDNELHLSPWESPDYSVIVAELEEHVFEHGRMVGVLIVLPFGALEAKPFNAAGEDWIAWRKLGPVFLVEDRIFIRNRYAEGKVDQRVLEAVGCESKSGLRLQSPP